MYFYNILYRDMYIYSTYVYDYYYMYMCICIDVFICSNTKCEF